MLAVATNIQDFQTMTITRGVSIVAAPCCGARYAAIRYVSMNFSAFEYWTDGWRHGSLMPNDEGLRRCVCGRFVLTNDLVTIGTADTSDLPSIAHVPDERLPDCIAQAETADVEIAARLEYWRLLNHPYRPKYRQHRDAEEADTKAAWEAAHPDPRTWWDKLRRRKPPAYRRPPGSPFTCPAFEPTDEQLRNMERLSSLLLARQSDSRRGGDSLTLAELYREQGRFEEAEVTIQALDEKEKGVDSKVIATLIEEKQPAPTRYRM